MGLLSFDPDYRRVWMFPRNIRYIAPWKIYGILKVLMQCDADKSDEKSMYRLLAETGVKKKENVRDKNDGGMRTYFAQLEMLGLVYETGETGKYHYTIAGESISEEDNPLQVLQYQLLRHQYPSAYGMGANIKMDPRMKIKPFLFLLQLLHDERLGNYLTNKDVIVPVIYGHNYDCYELVVSKILECRVARNGLEDVIINPEIDMYTRRGNPAKALDNMKDIANTALNYLEATQLVIKEREKGVCEYRFNENYESLYAKLLTEKDLFIPIASKEERQSFQRSYGRYQNEKDTRKDATVTEKKESAILQFTMYKYIEFLNEHVFVYDAREFVKEMSKFGIGSDDAIAVVERLETKRKQLWENTYLEYAYSGGQYANEFEKATTNLFVSLGFEDSQWIGRRVSKDNWRGNFPDVFIKRAGSSSCGMSDAKATTAYSLGHSDMLKMKETYVHTNKEIDKSSILKYILYVAGGFKGNIDDSLMMLGKATGVPVSALDAKGLLKIKNRGFSTDFIEAKLLKSGRYVSSDEIELLQVEGA